MLKPPSIIGWGFSFYGNYLLQTTGGIVGKKRRYKFSPKFKRIRELWTKEKEVTAEEVVPTTVEEKVVIEIEKPKTTLKKKASPKTKTTKKTTVKKSTRKKK